VKSLVIIWLAIIKMENAFALLAVLQRNYQVLAVKSLVIIWLAIIKMENAFALLGVLQRNYQV
jgi:hypothetical protein